MLLTPEQAAIFRDGILAFLGVLVVMATIVGAIWFAFPKNNIKSEEQ